MNEPKRRYLIYQLMSTFDWIGRSDDYFERSGLLTRAIGIIRSLGQTEEAIFNVDIRYVVSEPSKFRAYKDKLNDVIEIEDQKERENAIFEYYVWLHDIRLLRNDE